MDAQEKEKRAREPNSQRKRRRHNKTTVQVKMGHGGTLDPLATGVLILGVGSGTKSLQSFLECTKTYETVVLFGASTDTYDRCGRVLVQRPYEHITKSAVLKAMDEFRGTIQQTPPLYSALKMNGKPLYEYAREGKPIPREIPTREVKVEELELLEWYEPGTHKFWWPREQAGEAETKLAQQVWKLDDANKSESSEDEEREARALAAHEATKRRFEQSVDNLIRDSPGWNKPSSSHRNPPMMSGALCGNPSAEEKVKAKEARKKGETNGVQKSESKTNGAANGAVNGTSDGQRQQNLVPEVDYSQPPPWTGKGPAAARIRMTVTSGFYVRSFCHDLGMKVGSVALMSELCRSRQSDFSVGTPTVLEYEDLVKGEEVWGPQIEAMLERWNNKQVGKTNGTAAPGKTTVGHGEKRKREDEEDQANGKDKIRKVQSDDEKSWNGISD